MRDLHLLSELARKQAGLFSRPQALALGITSSAVQRAVNNGLITVQLRGVYRFAGADHSRPAQLWAALLWAGDGAVLSHDSAARVWKLEGLPRQVPTAVDVTVPIANRASSLPTVCVHRTRHLQKVKDFATLDGFPITSLARTLVDLASILDASQLESAFDSAWRRAAENRLGDPRQPRSLRERPPAAGGALRGRLEAAGRHPPPPQGGRSGLHPRAPRGTWHHCFDFLPPTGNKSTQ